MRRAEFRILAALAALSLPLSAWSQRPYYLVPGVHPGYSLVSMRPTGTILPATAPNVGGMTWLPDGRLFIASMSPNNAGGPTGHLLGASNGYIFSGIPNAPNASNVTVVQAGSNYHMPSGAVALGDTLYVVDNKYGLTKLTPNGNGYTRSFVYLGIISDSMSNTGQVDANDWSHRTWNGGLLYKDGYFYVSVGMGLISGVGATDMTESHLRRGKGTVLKISKDGSQVDTVAGGVRNPVSMAWGPDGEMFYTDNQGSYMPASAMFHVRPGRFFGHPKTPFDNGPRTPPAIIFPYGSSSTGGTEADPVVTSVATDMLTLRTGPYASQILVGTNHTTGLNRVFLEKVDGEYQGALFPFSQGLGVGAGTGSPSLPGVLPDFRANVHNLSYGPDGHIYLGAGNSPGSAGRGAHGPAGGQLGGLARLAPTGTTVFEMKAVRSRSATQMEIEFSEPVVSVDTSNFKVRQSTHVQGGTTNTSSYGAGYMASNKELRVSGVSLDESKRRVTLTLVGLQERAANTATLPGSIEDRTWGSLVQIHVSGITAVSGNAMWGDGNGGGVAWYTLNKFGPGTDVEGAVSIRSAPHPGGHPLGFHRTAEGIRVIAPAATPYDLSVRDLQGRILASYKGRVGDFRVPASALGAGVTVLEARSRDGRRWTTAVPKP